MKKYEKRRHQEYRAQQLPYTFCVKCGVSFSDPGIKKKGRYCSSCRNKIDSLEQRLRRRIKKGLTASHLGSKIHKWCTDYSCINYGCPNHQTNYKQFVYRANGKKYYVPKLTKDYRTCEEYKPKPYPYQVREAAKKEEEEVLNIKEEYVE